MHEYVDERNISIANEINRELRQDTTRRDWQEENGRGVPRGKRIILSGIMSKEYCEKGDKCYEKGDYDGAIANYVKALQTNPNCAILCYKLGCAWLKKGDIDEAIAYYEKSIFLESNNTIVLYKRGILWKQKGEFDNAIADFDAVLRLDPNNQDAINNRDIALSLKSRKRISKIKKEFEITKKEQREKEQNLSRSAQFRCEKCGLQLFIARPFTYRRYLNKFWCLGCYEQMK